MDWNRYKRALEWVSEAHLKQIYGQVPYIHHLLAVERQLFIYSYHPLTPQENRKLPLDVCNDLLMACLLHDIVEDTEATVEDVELHFGDRVSQMVWAVTNEPGKSRKEKFVKTYPKIRNTPYALIVKLCDRLANFESCLSHRLTKNRIKIGKLYWMYRDEHPTFRRELFQDGKYRRMWDRLDALAALEPESCMEFKDE